MPEALNPTPSTPAPGGASDPGASIPPVVPPIPPPAGGDGSGREGDGGGKRRVWPWALASFVVGGLVVGLLVALVTGAPWWRDYPNPAVPSPYAFALAVLLTAVVFGLFAWAATYSHGVLQQTLRAPASAPNPANAPVPWTPTPEDRSRILETYLTLKSPLTMLTSAIVLAVMLVFLTNIVVPGNENMLNRLDDPDYARGIITYLFSVGTIGVIILVVFATLTRRGDEQDRERYERSKTFVSLLLGIFGTIVGFYYGQSADGDEGPTVQVAEFSVPDEAAPGEDVVVEGVVTGGRPPYFVLLRVDDDARALPVDEVGNFADTVTVALDAIPVGETDTTLPVTVEVRDSGDGVFRTMRAVRVVLPDDEASPVAPVEEGG